MDDLKPHVIPAAAVKGIATGLLMMAGFTLIWAGIAFGGLHANNYAIALAGFAALAIVFAVKGIRLFGVAKYFPALVTEEDLAREKQTGKWFGIIFGAEGLGIFIAINIVNNLGHPELVIPAIALVVGLHFYPLARVFRRTIDYYLATWATLIAVLGFVLSLNKTLDQPATMGFVGIGIAIATSCYGLYMLKAASKVIRQVPV